MNVYIRIQQKRQTRELEETLSGITLALIQVALGSPHKRHQRNRSFHCVYRGKNLRKIKKKTLIMWFYFRNLDMK